MKKILSFSLLIVFMFTLGACNNKTDVSDPTQSQPGSIIFSGVGNVTLTVGDTFDPMQGVTALDENEGDISSAITIIGLVNLNNAGTYILTYSVTNSSGGTKTAQRTITVLTLEGCGVHQDFIGGKCVDRPKENIVIMHGAPFEVDPFHANFTGTEQLIKQQRQRQVEEQFNVNVIYRSYPSNAPWGPDRVEAIIKSSVDGQHLADIYWSVSDWIQQLVKGDAIVPVDQYLDTYGSNIHAGFRDIGSYQQNVYGFGTGNLTVSDGLYYNANLVASLGVDNPTDLFLNGQWTWSRFDQWAVQVQTALSAQGDDMFALGGVLAFYAEHMIPLNGGSLINKTTGRVAFAQKPALDTYSFLHDLYNKGVFETAPAYDSGSPLWMAGKVAMHPGSLWFVTAENRWGNLRNVFELGFVPYPKADAYQGDYVSPVSGVAIYHLASGMTAERQALVFQVWNALQIWKTETQLRNEFELSLVIRFDEEKYIDAYMMIYDKVYLDLINAIGINPYTTNGWRANINAAIRDGDARTVVDSIRPIYEAALDEYLNG